MTTLLEPMSIFWIVSASALLSSAFLASALLFQRVFPRASAAIRHVVWLAALVVALLVPVTAVLIPARWGAAGTAVQHVIRVDQATIEQTPVAEPELVRPMLTMRRSAAENVARGFVALWLLGFVGIVAHLIASGVRLRAVLNSAQPVSDRVLAGVSIQGDDSTIVRQTDRIDLPLTAGLLRPVVLLPDSAISSWSSRRLRAALLHEFAHVHRRDVVWQIAGRVVCAVYWFNPLVWFAARQCALAAEQACDDAVLDAGIRPSSYAGHLLDIARWAAQRSQFAVAVGQGSELEGRITAVLSPIRARRGLSGRTLKTVALAAGALAITLGTHRAVQPPGNEPALTAQVDRRIEPETDRRFEPEVDAALLRLLDDVDPAVRAAAARSAGELQLQSAIRPLLNALTDAHPQVRARAARSLGELENPHAIDRLQHTLLHDPDGNVRREAANALGEMENDAAAAVLNNALVQVNSSGMRRQIIRALGETRSATAVTALEVLINGPDEDSRHTALEALTNVRSPQATRLLLGAMNSDDAGTRRIAARAIVDAQR